MTTKVFSLRIFENSVLKINLISPIQREKTHIY